MTEAPDADESASEYSTSEGENDEVGHVEIEPLDLGGNEEAYGGSIYDTVNNTNEYLSENEEFFDACSNLGDESLAGKMQAPEIL